MAALLNVVAFKGMQPAELCRIEAQSQVIEFRDGRQIFGEGDTADAVYVIIGGEGHVRIGAIDRSSKGIMIEICCVGDIFGEVAVIDGSPRTADAVAEGRIRVMRINSRVFLDALHTNPVLGTNLCWIFAARMRRTFALFQDATFESLEVRLARQVLYLAKREGRATEHGLQLAGRFRQNDLADLLGATTRSIITVLNAWRASGLVIYDPARAQLTISRQEDLQRLVERAPGSVATSARDKSQAPLPGLPVR
jgi:CRP/FNR family transcriptional regulator, cyclic AMP receptor protein